MWDGMAKLDMWWKFGQYRPSGSRENRFKVLGQGVCTFTFYGLFFLSLLLGKTPPGRLGRFSWSWARSIGNFMGIAHTISNVQFMLIMIMISLINTDHREIHLHGVIGFDWFGVSWGRWCQIRKNFEDPRYGSEVIRVDLRKQIIEIRDRST